VIRRGGTEEEAAKVAYRSAIDTGVPHELAAAAAGNAAKQHVLHSGGSMKAAEAAAVEATKKAGGNHTSTPQESQFESALEADAIPPLWSNAIKAPKHRSVAHERAIVEHTAASKLSGMLRGISV